MSGFSKVAPRLYIWWVECRAKCRRQQPLIDSVQTKPSPRKATFDILVHRRSGRHQTIRSAGNFLYKARFCSVCVASGCRLKSTTLPRGKKKPLLTYMNSDPNTRYPTAQIQISRGEINIPALLQAASRYSRSGMGKVRIITPVEFRWLAPPELRLWRMACLGNGYFDMAWLHAWGCMGWVCGR